MPTDDADEYRKRAAKCLLARLSKLQLLLLSVITIALIVALAAIASQFWYAFIFYRVNESFSYVTNSFSYPTNAADLISFPGVKPIKPAGIALVISFILVVLIIPLAEKIEKKHAPANWFVWALPNRACWGIFVSTMVAPLISGAATVGMAGHYGNLKSLADAGSFVRAGESTKSDFYFNQMIEKWHRMQGGGLYSETDKMEIKQSSPTQFEIIVTNLRFAPASDTGIGKDIGAIGRAYSIEILRRIIWMCGSHIRDVVIIRVNLTVSGYNSVEYDVTLSPKSDLYRDWQNFNDETLKILVSRSVVVAKDTASGKRWVRVPAH